MLIHSIINQQAGTAIDSDLPALCAEIRRVFESAGHDLMLDVVAPDKLHQAMQKAAQTPIEVLLIGGGDGTIRSAAALTMNSDIAIGIIPLGTHNRLAKDLNLPLDPIQAAQALVHGAIERIDVATANGKVFLCNSLIGLPPLFATERQRLRGRPLLERIVRYFAVIRQLLASRKRISLQLESDGRVEKIKALSMAITNNPYDEAYHIGLVRPDLATGQLAVYVSRHTSGWAMARAFIKAFLGQWKGDLQLLKLRTNELTINNKSGKLKLSNDGEVEDMTCPIHYKCHPGALAVLRADHQSQTSPLI